jgi:hypothetical protein
MRSSQASGACVGSDFEHRDITVCAAKTRRAIKASCAASSSQTDSSCSSLWTGVAKVLYVNLNIDKPGLL